MTVDLEYGRSQPQLSDLPDKEVHPYEVEMLERVNRDFSTAKSEMNAFHEACIAKYREYGCGDSSSDFGKKTDTVPLPELQKQVDQVAADMNDKLWYKNQPVNIVAQDEEADQAAVDAKKALFTFQDNKDRLRSKTGMLGRDACLYGVCFSQTDYTEISSRKWVTIREEVPVIDPETGQPVIDPMTGEPITQEVGRRVLGKKILYRGSTVKRIDPINIFFSLDKERLDDDCPIMVRSVLQKSEFRGANYINLDQVKELGEDAARSDKENEKRQVSAETSGQSSTSKKGIELIEWQGPCNRLAITKYLIETKRLKTIEEDPNDGVDLSQIEDDDQVWAICAVAGNKVVARLQISAFELDRPNIDIGWIMQKEFGLLGLGIGHKITSLTSRMHAVAGMLVTNFKQSVNLRHIVNQTLLENPDTFKVNEPGAIGITSGDVTKVVHPLLPVPVSRDIWQFQEYLTQQAQDASAAQDIISGKGDRAAGTFGEANIVMTQAALRMRDYLKEFESFIERLYETRDHINSRFLDTGYVVSVVGKDGIEWKQLTPEMLQNNVEFNCEASQRETNRIVITQQILQLAQITARAGVDGTPVRFDVLLEQLVSAGFSWSRSLTERYLPLIAFERKNPDVDVNGMLVDNYMIQTSIKKLAGIMQMGQLAAMGGGAAAPTGGGAEMPTGGEEPPDSGGLPGGNLASPMSEQGAVESMTQQAAPQPIGG